MRKKKQSPALNAEAMKKIKAAKDNFGQAAIEGLQNLHAMAVDFDAESISGVMKWNSPEYAVEGEYLPEVTLTVRKYRPVIFWRDGK